MLTAHNLINKNKRTPIQKNGYMYQTEIPTKGDKGVRARVKVANGCVKITITVTISKINNGYNDMCLWNLIQRNEEWSVLKVVKQIMIAENERKVCER